MKRIKVRVYLLLGVLVLGMLFSALPICAEVQGDINGDGMVSIQDATILLVYLASPDGSEYQEAHDVNGDGYVTIKDVTVLLQIIQGVSVPKTARLTLKKTERGISVTAINLPSNVTQASVLVLNSRADATTWRDNLDDVKGIAQLLIENGTGDCVVSVDDPSAAYIVVVSYNGGQLVKEVR